MSGEHLLARIIFLILGVLIVGFILLSYKVLTIPDHIATKRDVAAAQGKQNLVDLCKENIKTTMKSAGVDAKSFSQPDVELDGNKADVTVRVASAAYSGPLVCHMTKSIWYIQQVEVVK